MVDDDDRDLTTTPSFVHHLCSSHDSWPPQQEPAESFYNRFSLLFLRDIPPPVVEDASPAAAPQPHAAAAAAASGAEKYVIDLLDQLRN